MRDTLQSLLVLPVIIAVAVLLLLALPLAALWDFTHPRGRQ